MLEKVLASFVHVHAAPRAILTSADAFMNRITQKGKISLRIVHGYLSSTKRRSVKLTEYPAAARSQRNNDWKPEEGLLAFEFPDQVLRSKASIPNRKGFAHQEKGV